MKFKIIKRKNSQDRSQEKYYPAPVYTDEIGVDELAEEISYATSMTPTDVKAVLEGLLNVMPKHLRRGSKIKLDRFGASEMKKAVLTDMPFQKVT